MDHEAGLRLSDGDLSQPEHPIQKRIVRAQGRAKLALKVHAAAHQLSEQAQRVQAQDQVLDGPAWTAAIASAAHQLADWRAPYIGAILDGDTVEIQIGTAGTEATIIMESLPVGDLCAAGLGPWAATAIREGLRRSVGLACARGNLPWCGPLSRARR